MKEEGSLFAVSRLMTTMVVVLLVTSMTMAAGKVMRYDFPGHKAGAIAFDDKGGLYAAEGNRSEKKGVKIYYLRNNKLVKTITVDVTWIGALAYDKEKGQLWATTGSLAVIDPSSGEIIKKIEGFEKVYPPNEYTGITFQGNKMVYSGTREIGGLRYKSGPPKGYKCGGLAYDGESLWMLYQPYGLLVKMTKEWPEDTPPEDLKKKQMYALCERGLVIPPDLKGYRLWDIDWYDGSFWVAMSKRVGINKLDNAIIRVESVEHTMDRDRPHSTVKINTPWPGRLELQRKDESQVIRKFRTENGEYSIPEGEYKILECYYIIRDDQNFPWKVTRANAGDLSVKAGRDQELKISLKLAVKFQIKPPALALQQGMHSLHFGIVDEDGVYVKVRRVALTPYANFIMRDSNNMKIAEGHLFPAIDRYTAYNVLIPRRAKLPLTIKLDIDTGPIEIVNKDIVIQKLPK